jgi:hypothetical protein
MAANPVHMTIRLTAREHEALGKFAEQLPLSRGKRSRGQAIRWIIEQWMAREETRQLREERALRKAG